MNISMTPSRRVVNEIRAHLERPGHCHERWVVPSLTGDPRREISIVASRDAGDDLGRGKRYALCLHLSLMAHVDAVPAEMLDDDLAGWARGILGGLARYADAPPPARPGDPHYLSIWSPMTSHVRVYLDRRGRPLSPSGDLVVTPWRTAS